MAAVVDRSSGTLPQFVWPKLPEQNIEQIPRCGICGKDDVDDPDHIFWGTLFPRGICFTHKECWKKIAPYEESFRKKITEFHKGKTDCFIEASIGAIHETMMQGLFEKHEIKDSEKDWPLSVVTPKDLEQAYEKAFADVLQKHIVTENLLEPVCDRPAHQLFTPNCWPTDPKQDKVFNALVDKLYKKIEASDLHGKAAKAYVQYHTLYLAVDELFKEMKKQSIEPQLHPFTTEMADILQATTERLIQQLHIQGDKVSFIEEASSSSSSTEEERKQPV